MKFNRILFSLLLAFMLFGFSSIARAQGPEQQASRKELLNSFHTVFIESKTQFFKPEALARELYKIPAINAWDITMVDNAGAADVRIVVDRQAFDYVFKMIDQKSSIILGAGKIIAIDGVRAAPGIAEQITSRIKAARPVVKQRAGNDNEEVQQPTLIRKSQPSLLRRDRGVTIQ